jgi:multidrug efflux system membrane fusion protein
LWKQDSIPQQTLATQQATVEQLKATVQADQAQIDTAKVQLNYTTIRAPIGGRTGTRLVDPGNIVHATDSTGIVVINQIDPIAVIFTLPEDKFQNINQAIRASGKPLQVEAYARQDGSLLSTGKLTLINNQIDTATGTVQIKAVFPNSSHTLWPGQYVNMHLVLGTREHAVVVPSSVVQRGPNGLYAYIVKADDTVAVQPVRVGPTQDGKAIIDDGLAAGARIVVEGQYKLKPGSKVTEVKPAVATPASAETRPAPGNAGQKKAK